MLFYNFLGNNPTKVPVVPVIEDIWNRIETTISPATDGDDVALKAGEILSVLERLGIGTSAPGHKLDIITGETNNSEFHFGEQVNQGAWFTSSVPHQLVISAGAEIVSDTWIARSSVASVINLANGEITFLSKTELLPGFPLVLDLKLIIAANGKVGIGNILNPDEKLHVDGNVKAIDLILSGNNTSLPDGTKAITQTADDNSLKLATTEYADAAGGGGDVVGPASSFNNVIARFGSATGKLLKNSGVGLDDSNNLSTPGRLITQNTSPSSIQSQFGGASIAKDLFVGENLTVLKDVSFDQNLNVTGNIKQKVYINTVSDPPTSLQLTNIFGTPAIVGDGFSARINNGGTGANYYMIESDGVNWWIFAGTKAL
jgi:hypothetical protein